MGCSTKKFRIERLPISNIPILFGLEALIASYPKDKPEDRPTSRTLDRNLRSECIIGARPPHPGQKIRCLRHSRLRDQPPRLGERIEQPGMPASITIVAARNTIPLIQPPGCRPLCGQTQRAVFPNCLEWFLLLNRHGQLTQMKQLEQVAMWRQRRALSPPAPRADNPEVRLSICE